MNRKQENKLAMYAATLRVLKNNEPVWAKAPAFTDHVRELETKIGAITEVSARQVTDITGVAEDKARLKQELADATWEIASVLYAYARKSNNATLRKAVAFSRSRLASTPDPIMAQRCGNILATGRAHAAALKPYGIGGPALDVLKRALDDWVQHRESVKAARSQRAAETRELLTLFGLTDVLLVDELDRMVVPYRKMNAEFYNAYSSSRVIYDLGKTSQLIELVVAPASSIVVERVIIGSTLINTGPTAIMVTGDTEENENGLQVLPGDRVTLHLTNPVITVLNQHSSITGKFKVRVSSTLPTSTQRTGISTVITVPPGESRRVEHIVPGSQAHNMGPADVTLCDCAEADCGITDDDQPCGYEQTIEANATGMLDTQESFVNITNKDAKKSARVKVVVVGKR